MNEISEITITIKQTQQQFRSSTPRQKATLRTLLNTYWTNLDNKVYQLYDLTNDQISFFNERGRNINRIEILDRL